MQNLVKLPHLLFLLLFFSLPLSKGATSVAVGGLFVFSLWKLITQQLPKPKIQDWALLSPIAVFLALLISLFYTENLERGFNLIYRQNTLLVFPFFFYAYQKLIQSKWQQYFQAFIYASLLAAVLTLIFFFLPEYSLQKLTQKLSFLQDFNPQHKQTAFGAYSPFMDRLHFGYLLGIALLLQIWRCLVQEKSWFNLGILLLLFTAFTVLGARGAQLAFLASLPIWIGFLYKKWLRPKVQKRLGKTLSNALLIGIIAIVVLALPYWVYKNVPAVSERYNQLIWEIKIFQADDLKSHDYVHFTSVRRIMSWNNTWQLIQNQAITGVGIGDYEADLAAIYAQDDLDFPVNSHHQFLYYWAAGGMTAIMTFIMSFLFFIRKIWKEKQEADLALGLAFGLFYFVIFMFDVPLLYTIGSTGFFAFYGLLLLNQKTLKKEF